MKLRCWISLLLATVMLFAMVGCRPGDSSGDGKQDVDMLTLVADAKSAYQIVRSDSAKPEVRDAFLLLRDAITQKTTVALTMETDWADEIATEILVGTSKREASGKVLRMLQDLQELGDLVGQSFAICVRGQALHIVGTDDEATAYGVKYFIQNYVDKAQNGVIAVPRNLEITMTVAEMLLAEDVQGSALKGQYSDHVESYTETPLLNFDSLEMDGVDLYEDFELDEYYAKEGDAALRFTMTKSDKSLTTLMWHKGEDSFAFSAADRNKTTMKLWLFVDDTDKVSCDHDEVYGKRQKGQATFFFRVFDKQGRVFAWNHTLTRDGWHEIELTFNVHNGVDSEFDYEHIVGFGVLVAADKGTIVELDDLRAVHYESDHTPEPAPDGGRLITDGEYDAFDGAVVQEWYGCSYDLTDKKFGSSSLRCEGDNSVTDFRTIISGLDMPLSYENDVLVFWMKVEDLSAVDSLFIEFNQDQDVHEYERTFHRGTLKEYGLSDTAGEWCKITIPLSDFELNLNPEKYGDSQDIRMFAFRLVVGAHPNKTYVVHFDRVYLTTKSALGM